MPGFHDSFIAPLFQQGLLTPGLLFFTLFLLLIRPAPARARGGLLLFGSLFFIGWSTSYFYLSLFLAFAAGLYGLLFWMQKSSHKKGFSSLLSLLVVVLYFLCLDHPSLASPWTGSAVHNFGIAYSLFRFLSVILEVGK